jgi:hypothetical protein
MTTNPSWQHPDRACTEDDRYVEVLVTKGQGTKEERDRMAKACLACGDYLDCLEDVIAAGKAWEFREVQAAVDESAARRTVRSRSPE